MWRRVGLLACYAVGWSAAHPLCFVNDKPTNLDKTESTFCPEKQDDGGAFVQAGSCCTDEEEGVIKSKFEETTNLTDECSELYKQVMCGTCHSFSAHLYEKLGAELGPWDGMTMTRGFCTKFEEECSKKVDGYDTIDFPDYPGGVSYCDKHVGNNKGDNYWSFPYTEDEIFEGGYSEVMPDADLPTKAYSMKQSPDGSMYWISGLEGEIKKVMASNMTASSTVVDISGGDFYLFYEEGLLDFVFDPNFDGNNFFYVSYTINSGEGQQNQLSRFTYKEGDAQDTRSSEKVLATSAIKDGNIHSGGWVGFKPSSYGKGEAWNDLYWTTGDGGLQKDLNNNSQNVQGLLGAVVRISVPSDPSIDELYRVPAGNYIEKDPQADEKLCANGFRNPWKCSFDRKTDELYCGDVGHIMVEEIDIVECGKNYGWSRFEGGRCQSEMEDRDGPCKGANREGFEFPIFQYCHPDYHSKDDDDEKDNCGGVDICGDRELTGLSVIGGFVYRGMKLADLLYGAYVFADWNNRGVYYIKKDENEVWKSGTIISDRSIRVVAFAEDLDGELMIMNGHSIYNLPCGDLCGDPVPTFSVPEEEYLGCFKDVEGDRLFTYTNESMTDMKASVCKEICGDSDLYGIQYARECWCRDPARNPADYDRHGTATCDMPCTGDLSEKCGGSWSVSVYRSGDGDSVPPTTTSSTYLGCFTDQHPKRGGTRIFSHGALISEDEMTSSFCRSECAGHSYYGMQNGNECWCGEVDDEYDQHGESTGCSAPCSGNGHEYCGGRLSMDVYSMGDDPSLTPTPTPALATPTPSTPTGNTTPSTHHLGCFRDEYGVEGDGRLFTKAPESSEKMSSAVCRSQCAGYSYYGMQYATQCWCGGDGANYGQYGTSTECTTPCPGDGDEYCGGSWSMNVYSMTGDPAPTPIPSTSNTPFHLGCYKDAHPRQGGTRIFSKEALGSENEMSSSFCRSECAGYSYYGMQNGNEVCTTETKYTVHCCGNRSFCCLCRSASCNTCAPCWCGTDADEYDQLGESTDCTAPCPGNEEEYCGGRLSMDVYLMGSSRIFSPPTRG